MSLRQGTVVVDFIKNLQTVGLLREALLCATKVLGAQNVINA